MTFTPTCFICKKKTQFKTKKDLITHLIEKHTTKEMIKVLSTFGYSDYE